MNFNEEFYVFDAKLKNNNGNAALCFTVKITDCFLKNFSGKISEIGALILPLELTDGKDMRYNKPIYSNKGYSIRGYANIHRANGEYTYNDSAVLAIPKIVKAKKQIDKNSFTVTVTDIKKEHYCRFYCVVGYVKYFNVNNGTEQFLYTKSYQSCVYAAALNALNADSDNEFAKDIVNYCEVIRKKIYFEEQFSVAKLPVFTAKHLNNFKIYRLKNNLAVAELGINWYNNGNSTEIVQITDAHLNYVNEKDYSEVDPAVMSTAEHRIWCCDGATAEHILRAMEYASFADKIVCTGDILDYCSNGCLQLTERLCFKNTVNNNKYNTQYNKVVATLGNHEPTREMEGKVHDRYTAEYNISLLQKNWPNDLSYHSEIVFGASGKNPVKIILLNNSKGVYTDESTEEKLLTDLTSARNKNMPVLIFQHIPLYCGTDETIKGFLKPNVKANTKHFCASAFNINGLTENIYNTIKENADIIRGIFCGHYHEYFYCELSGTGKAEGYFIPQHIFQAVNADDGYVMKINIK